MYTCLCLIDTGTRVYKPSVAVYDTYMINETYEDLIENHGLTRLPDGYRYNIGKDSYVIFFQLEKQRKFAWMGWTIIKTTEKNKWEIDDKTDIVDVLSFLYEAHFNPPKPPKDFIDDFVGTMP